MGRPKPHCALAADRSRHGLDKISRPSRKIASVISRNGCRREVN